MVFVQVRDGKIVIDNLYFDNMPPWPSRAHPGGRDRLIEPRWAEPRVGRERRRDGG
jgi:hypothetical protein